MIAARSRPIVLLGLALLAAIVMLSWTQRWFTVSLTDSVELDVLGSDAAGSLAALALSLFALVAALSIASVAVRRVLGVLAAAVGAIIVTVSHSSLTDPARSASAIITEVTGISGIESIRALVLAVETSFWPSAALVAGGLIVFVGLGATFSAHRWPSATKKYERASTVIADDPASQWDAQNRGVDPTDG